MLLFGLESQQFGDYVNGYRKFRWFSKYNGARGPWCWKREEAEAGGNEHHKIILALHGKEEIDNSAQQTNGGASLNG